MSEASLILALNETRKTLLASRVRKASAGTVLPREAAAILPGDGFWLESCNQVDTSDMPLPLDLMFLDHDHTVVATITAVQPGMCSAAVAGAAHVLELPPGTIPLSRTEKGDRIRIEAIGAAEWP